MPHPIKELPASPAERALRVIAGRWKLAILWHLLDTPRRLTELRRCVPGITQKVLLQQLRELEHHGLILRRVFTERPVRVEYGATEMGQSLRPLIGALCAWGRHHEAGAAAAPR